MASQGWKEAPDHTGKAPKHKAAANKDKLSTTARAPMKKTLDVSMLESFRKEMVEKYGDESLQAYCMDVSIELCKKLKSMNIDCKVIQGTFYLDNPNDTEDDPDEVDINNPIHYWVESNGKVIDLTGVQFQDEVEDETLPNIIVGTYDELFRYTKIKSIRKKI